MHVCVHACACTCVCVFVFHSVSCYYIVTEYDHYRFIMDDIIIVQGNKKGPVKRWDFDTEDAYSEYQSRREAMPK